MRAAIDRSSTSPPAARAGTASRLASLAPLFLLHMLWASPTAAALPAGTSSTSTIHITLSVAPRLGLKRIDRPEDSNAAGYCIRGNIGRTSLPVHLLWPSTGESSNAAADIGHLAHARHGTEIPWCAGEAAGDGVPAGRERTGLALISPE